VSGSSPSPVAGDSASGYDAGLDLTDNFCCLSRINRVLPANRYHNTSASAPLPTVLLVVYDPDLQVADSNFIYMNDVDGNCGHAAALVDRRDRQRCR